LLNGVDLGKQAKNRVYFSETAFFFFSPITLFFALLAYFAVIPSIFPSIQILITLVFFSWLLGSTFKIAKLGCSVCVLSRMAPSLSVYN